MRIGIDGFPLVTPKTGVGHYTFELATAMARLAPEHSFELIAPADFPAEVLDQIESIPNLRAVSIRTNLITGRWWAIGLPRYVSRERLDMFHGTNYEVPLRNRRRSVLTVHDLSIITYPETHDRRIVSRARRRLPIMLRSAARIITPTVAVKGELIDRFTIAPERIAVTPEAPRATFSQMSASDASAIRERFGIDEEFILFVGTIEPRKNLPTLLRAFARLLQTRAHRPQLVIAGARGWVTEEFDRTLAGADLGDRLRLIGYVGDDELRALYSSCRLLVYPSLYEGFGLPPLEAMACGAPVIAGRIAALTETLDGNACLVEPTDEHALAEAIVKLIESPGERERLSRSGVAHAATFSWENTARLTLQVYEEVASEAG